MNEFPIEIKVKFLWIEKGASFSVRFEFSNFPQRISNYTKLKFSERFLGIHPITISIAQFVDK